MTQNICSENLSFACFQHSPYFQTMSVLRCEESGQKRGARGGTHREIPGPAARPGNQHSNVIPRHAKKWFVICQFIRIFNILLVNMVRYLSIMVRYLFRMRMRMMDVGADDGGRTNNAGLTVPPPARDVEYKCRVSLPEILLCQAKVVFVYFQFTFLKLYWWLYKCKK